MGRLDMALIGVAGGTPPGIESQVLVDETLVAAVGRGDPWASRSSIGSAWPRYLTVNLMTMDYGPASPGVCVVSGGTCDMGQSTLQAAYNLHDHLGISWANIELTPMIGGNDVASEHFTLADVDTVSSFAKQMSPAGVHYWSYDIRIARRARRRRPATRSEAPATTASCTASWPMV